MTDLTKFRQYKEIADQQVAITGKEQLAERVVLFFVSYQINRPYVFPRVDSFPTS